MLEFRAKVIIPIIIIIDTVKLKSKALREGGNLRVTVRELPGLNHLFQTATTGAVDEYARIEETVAPVALETLAKWMKNEVVRK